jgi:hypothetical protein
VFHLTSVGAVWISAFQIRNRSLVEAQNDSRSAHQNRPFDQVRILRHQPERLGARRRILFHAALAIEFVARIQKQLVIAIANQFVELRDGEFPIEVGLFERDALFAKQTLRFAAGGSSGLEVELEHFTIIGHCRELAGRLQFLAGPP